MIERYSNPEMARIWSLEGKFDQWLRVEVAACQAWAQVGAIPQEDADKISENARYDMNRVEEVFRETHHDVTAFLRSVQESLGPEGRFVHLGLTSNDVWDTATSLQLVAASDLLENDVADLIALLEDKALEHAHTLMIGRTHGVHAEPMTFGLKIGLWVEEMRRNRQRLAEAKRTIAVGKLSGAVGTYASVPPKVEEIVCRQLGLEAASISNQILQRDRHAQFVGTLALIGSSLEKFATEIRHLQRTEVREAEEPFEAGQTGSSAMPHKRNPELCERISGLARLQRGYATTALENVALWHERDISHSSTERVILPDACLIADYTLQLFAKVMAGLRVFPQRMKENLEMTKGLVFSQRVLLTFIEKGLSRGDAYEIVQRNAMRAWEEGSDFLELLKGDSATTEVLSVEELEGLFDYGYYLQHVDEVIARLKLSRMEKPFEARTLAPSRL